MHQLTTEGDSIDKTVTFDWLHDGRIRAAAEAHIFAVQDGSLITCHYEQSVLGKAVKPICRVCNVGHDTVGHILPSCQEYRWQMYKDGHDAILNVIVAAVTKSWEITIDRPEATSAVHESALGCIWVDTTIPTDEDLRARQPDLILRLKISGS